MKTATMILICIAFLATALTAQEKGSISGLVIEKESKQPLPGANVRILGTLMGATTNLYGRFTIDNVPENIYKLQIDFIGFTSHIETDVRVVRNKITQIREIQMIESVVEGDAIVVTAGAFEQTKDAPVSNYNYSREEIRRSPGAAGDIFRAIETLPGVSSSGGEFSSFSVRGGSPRDNIILIDNIPFNRVSHFDGGTEDQEAQGGRFSIFTPGLVEEANFQAGGFGARYGGKNASMIDIRIKEGNRENPTMNASYDVIGWEYNYDGPTYLNRNTSLVFSARHQDFQNILNATGQKDLGHPRFTDLVFKTTTWINGAHKISVLGIFAPEYFDRTIRHVYESDNEEDTQLADGEESKALLGVNWRYLTSKNSFLQTSVYYENIHNKFVIGRAYTDPINGVVPSRSLAPRNPDVFVSKDGLTQYGAKSNFTYLFAKGLSTTVGVEANQYALDYRYRLNGLDTSFVFDQTDVRPNPSEYYVVLDPSQVNTSNTDTKNTFAAFNEWSYTLSDYVTFNPGVRYEYSQFNKKSTVSPRASVTYQITPRTAANAAAGVYYQTPEPGTIAADPRNRNLRSEKAIHTIVGVTRYLTDNLRLNVEAYYKSFDDLLVRPDRGSFQRTNAGDGRARGVDIGLLRRFVNKWYGQVNYSYAQSKRDDHNGEGEYNSDFNQPHVFNILLGYEVNKEWSFSAKWKYATGRPKDSFIVHEDVLSDPNRVRYSKEITGNNTRRLDPFHTLNLRIDYRKQLGRIALVGFVDILNVYGHLNVNEERFIERRGEIEKLGFQTIPTIGLKLEI